MSVVVEYINHSGYVIKSEDATLVFDFVLGMLPRKYLDTNKPVLFFVTHSHDDHYHPSIFSYRKQVIVSEDVKVPADCDAIVVKPGDNLIVEGLKISVFDSTDLGVSYYVQTKHHNIFHAGDLNLWHWKEESTQDEIDLATFQFLNIIEDIKPLSIDVAMFPVDPRMKRDYDWGARIFISEIKPKYFFPMHYKEAEDIVHFEKWSKQQKFTKVFIPREDNEKFMCEVHRLD